ncbi:hypothetical protein H8E06_01305 [bacterium]|nr:hypothetical protein [bacterium]
MASKKKFRTIREVYESGQPLEKPAPKKFKTITALYRSINEADKSDGKSYTISAQDETGSTEVLGTVDSALKDEIHRDVYRHTRELNKHFNGLLDAGGFQFQEFNNYLFGIIKNYDVDADKFSRFLKNRSNRKLSDLLSGPYGEFEMEEYFLPVVDEFGIIERSGGEKQQFYNELVRGSFKIQGTNVGEGEFMLAMLSDAKKVAGEGDVSSGGVAFEIGTQQKTLPGPWAKGRSGKAIQGDARIGQLSYLMMKGNNPAAPEYIDNINALLSQEDGQKKAFDIIKDTLKASFGSHFNDNHITQHTQMILANPALSGPICGCYALNYYMLEHSDDYIVIMNYGGKMSAAKYGRNPGFTRYMYAKDWNTCYENIVNTPNFIVTCDGVNITRILIR